MIAAKIVVLVFMVPKKIDFLQSFFLIGYTHNFVKKNLTNLFSCSGKVEVVKDITDI